MEILYIYIQNFANIKNQGINLSSEFEFHTSHKNGKLHLTIQRNEKHIERFFGSNIRNVTAIIGQNGTGKTSVLEFIKANLPSGVGGVQSPSIVALKRCYHLWDIDQDDGSLNVDEKYEVFNFDIESPEIIDNTKLFRIHNRPSENDLGFVTYEEIPDDSHSRFIFYSNIFDGRVESSLFKWNLANQTEIGNSGSFVNISTNSLISSDRIGFTGIEGNKIDRIDAFKARELRRNLDFIRAGNHEALEFELPENLYISILEHDFKALREEDDLAEFLNRLEGLKKIKPEIEGLGTNEALVIQELMRAITLNFIRSNLRYLRSERLLLMDIGHFSGKNFEEAFVRFFSTLGNRPRLAFPVANKILEFVNFVKKALAKHTIVALHIDDPQKSFSIPISKNSTAEVWTFLQSYYQSRGEMDFIAWRWRNLSSGEQAMLTMLSRFHSLLFPGGDDVSSLGHNLIVLIDEGDLYFHPEWQRKFLSILLKYFEREFRNHWIQIIITSNAPYLVSDLPKSNIVFLEKGVEDSTKILNQRNKKSETFAANIHVLFKDSFFMKDALMGEFARGKIEEVIDELKSKRSLSIGDTKRLAMIIDIIGEPMIRDRLQEMLAEKGGRQAQIDLLEKRLKELRDDENGGENDSNQ